MKIETNGILVKAIAGFYYVEAGGRIYSCKARGIFRKQGCEPLVGDTVRITAETEGELDGRVEEILPRRNRLVRPPLANVTRLFIVSAYSNPAPNSLVIDKLIAIAENKGIEPLLIFNKNDQGDFSDWEEIYKAAGFEVFSVSCLTGDGIEAVRAALGEGISVFSGNSGVGKSSLLNRLFDGLALATGEVSEKLGRPPCRAFPDGERRLCRRHTRLCLARPGKERGRLQGGSALCFSGVCALSRPLPVHLLRPCGRKGLRGCRCRRAGGDSGQPV